MWLREKDRWWVRLMYACRRWEEQCTKERDAARCSGCNRSLWELGRMSSRICFEMPECC